MIFHILYNVKSLRPHIPFPIAFPVRFKRKALQGIVLYKI